jgi:protein-disulfide isomerase
MTMRPALRSAAIAAALALSCSSQPAGQGEAEVVATIDGDAITLAELDAWIKEDLFDEQTRSRSPAAVHEFRAERLQQMIDERLLEQEAQSRGVTTDEMLESASAGAAVTDDQVAAFYAENKDRIGGATLEQIGPRIRRHLEQQAGKDAVKRLLDDLRERAAVQVTFAPPRVEVATVGPSLGPEAAPVTIVEFSDFQCPFCSRAGPIVKQVLARYPEQVRVVYRHFPLDSIHPRARPAAEASACADEQGKFWAYHDKLFANAKQLEDADLERYAGEVGLDLAAWRACRTDGRAASVVERDLADARSAGVTGTPSFFVNGRMLGGAQPVEKFVELIEAELAAGSSAS